MNLNAKPPWPSADKVLEMEARGLQEVPFKMKNSGLTMMKLGGNRIRKLPKKIPTLQILSLKYNALNEIPSEMAKRIAGYKRLEQLDLANNGLTDWPKELETLEHIRSIILAENKLTSFSSSSKTLEHVDLSVNCFTDCPPAPPNIRALSLDFNKLSALKFSSGTLVKLTLSLTSITSITDLRCPKLEFLDISRNRLASLPDLSKLSKLRVLDVSDNFIVDFPKLPPNLKETSFRHNLLKSAPDFGKIYPRLTLIDVSENELTSFGSVPQSLVALFINSNKLTTPVRATVPTMKRLFASNNEFKDMPVIYQSQIEEFFLGFNKFTSIDVAAFRGHVTRIELTENQITEIPDDLYALPNLVALIVCRNKITEISDQWSRSPIQIANFSGNPLKCLPESWPRSLHSLFVSYCGLSVIPESLSHAARLTELVAFGNKLTHLPNLPAVQSLFLSQNRFETVPFLPASLRVLDMSLNKLTSLPDPFISESLEDADFSHNDIASLPAELTLPALKFFKISHNPRLKTLLKTGTFPKLVILNVEGTAMKYDKPPEVREFMTNQLELWSKSSVKLIRESEWVGFAEMCGARESMEDAIVVRESIHHDISAFAVFDGHGGYRTATAAAHLFSREVGERGAMTPDFLISALAMVNDRVRKMNLPDGSTAVVALRQKNRILFGHLGDARAIIVTDTGQIRFETVDHKPVSRTEYERVRDEGGKVVQGRTAAILAVTRSIGDFRVPGVSYVPEIDEITLENDDRWLVVACDGVWDVTFPTQIKNIAQSVASAAEFAYTLRNAAYAYGSLDNISAIAVDLRYTPDPTNERFPARRISSERPSAPLKPRGASIVYFVREDFEEGDDST
jgi:Leucine-rich repeat (LRR) protein